MRNRLLNKYGLAGLAMLALGAGGFETARAGDAPHGEKIEIMQTPGPRPVVVSNLNLNQLDPNQGNFKQVKEDLFRPFSSLDPRNSLQMQDFVNGQLPPPQRPMPSMMSRRTQELLDQKRNWAFTAFEELSSPQNELEKKIFGIKEYGEDGREEKPVSAIDRYYDSLGVKNAGATNRTAASVRAQFIKENGFDPLGQSFESSDPFMKRVFAAEEGDPIANQSDGIGLLELSDPTKPDIGTPEEIRMQEQRLDDMRRRILGNAASRYGSPGGEDGSLLPTDDYYSRTMKNSMGSLMTQQLSDAAEIKTKAANPFIVADPTANVLHSHVNDDLTARALGLPNPVVSQTNSISRPAPTAQSVTAEWDPFGANRPKPRF